MDYWFISRWRSIDLLPSSPCINSSFRHAFSPAFHPFGPLDIGCLYVVCVWLLYGIVLHWVVFLKVVRRFRISAKNKNSIKSINIIIITLSQFKEKVLFDVHNFSLFSWNMLALGYNNSMGFSKYLVSFRVALLYLYLNVLERGFFVLERVKQNTACSWVGLYFSLPLVQYWFYVEPLFCIKSSTDLFPFMFPQTFIGRGETPLFLPVSGFFLLFHITAAVCWWSLLLLLLDLSLLVPEAILAKWGGN